MQPVTAPAETPEKPAKEAAAKEAKAHVVQITERGFAPKSITVKVGETIEWKNDTKSAESVTADNTLTKKKSSVSLPKDASAFSSGDIAPGRTFSYTFTTAGAYKYVSLPHETKMSGSVTVKEEAAKKPAKAAPKKKSKTTSTKTTQAATQHDPNS